LDRIYFSPRANRQKMKSFEELLTQKHAGEVAHFLSKIALLRANYSTAEAELIYTRFIHAESDDSGSPFEGSENDTLNLSATMRASIRKRMVRGDSAAAFDEAVDECERLCVTNGFVAEFERLEAIVSRKKAGEFAFILSVGLLALTIVGVAVVLIVK
jgi:hypothetical protein